TGLSARRHVGRLRLPRLRHAHRRRAPRRAALSRRSRRAGDRLARAGAGQGRARSQLPVGVRRARGAARARDREGAGLGAHPPGQRPRGLGARARPRAAVTAPPPAATALEIRRARRDDVPAIVALYADDFLGATRENLADLAPYYAAFDVIAAEANAELMVAEEEGGRLVGTYQLNFITHLSHRGAKVAEVEAVRIA